MFIKRGATGYLLSGDRFKIQTSFSLFCPLVNFRLLSLFVKGKQIWSFDAGETHTRTIVLVGIFSKFNLRHQLQVTLLLIFGAKGK